MSERANTIITEMGYHPANDADNPVTRKLSASSPLEVKASVLHIALNQWSFNRVRTLLEFLSASFASAISKSNTVDDR